MLQAPWTEIGRLQQELMQLKHELSRKGDKYEINSLSSKVDSLERTNGQLSSEVACLRNELQELQENQIRLKERNHDK